MPSCCFRRKALGALGVPTACRAEWREAPPRKPEHCWHDQQATSMQVAAILLQVSAMAWAKCVQIRPQCRRCVSAITGGTVQNITASSSCVNPRRYFLSCGTSTKRRRTTSGTPQVRLNPCSWKISASPRQHGEAESQNDVSHGTSQHTALKPHALKGERERETYADYRCIFSRSGGSRSPAVMQQKE